MEQRTEWTPGWPTRIFERKLFKTGLGYISLQHNFIQIRECIVAVSWPTWQCFSLFLERAVSTINSVTWRISIVVFERLSKFHANSKIWYFEINIIRRIYETIHQLFSFKLNRRTKYVRDPFYFQDKIIWLCSYHHWLAILVPRVKWKMRHSKSSYFPCTGLCGAFFFSIFFPLKLAVTVEIQIFKMKFPIKITENCTIKKRNFFC